MRAPAIAHSSLWDAHFANTDKLLHASSTADIRPLAYWGNTLGFVMPSEDSVPRLLDPSLYPTELSDKEPPNGDREDDDETSGVQIIRFSNDEKSNN